MSIITINATTIYPEGEPIVHIEHFFDIEMLEGLDLNIHISTTPYTYGSEEKRESGVRAAVERRFQQHRFFVAGDVAGSSSVAPRSYFCHRSLHRQAHAKRGRQSRRAATCSRDGVSEYHRRRRRGRRRSRFPVQRSVSGLSFFLFFLFTSPPPSLSLEIRF